MRSNQCFNVWYSLLLTLWSVSAKATEPLSLKKNASPSLRLSTERLIPVGEDGFYRVQSPGIETAPAPTPAEIESAATTAETQGRVVLLTPAGITVPNLLKELTMVPVTFRSVIGNGNYDITVLRMTVTPEGTTVAVGCRFTVPNAAGKSILYFGANDIPVSATNGFGGDLPILESTLSLTNTAEMDDPQNHLGSETQFAEIQVPNFKGNATLGLGKTSKLTFSCGAFKKFTLTGFMKVHNLIEREDSSGDDFSDTKPLMLFWGTKDVLDWEDMFFEATASRGFHATSCKDLGFHFSEQTTVTLDLSRYRSPANLPDCGSRNKEEWQGVGFDAFQLRLPKLFKLRTPKALMGRGTDLFIDPNGLIGNVTAEKVFSLEEGYTDEINKFDLSLDAVSAVFGCGAAETVVTMSGRVRLGNCSAGGENKKALDYRIIYNEFGRKYQVMVKESANDRFQPTGMTLSTGSVLTLTVNEDGFLFKTALAEKPLLTTPAYHNSICLNYPATISVQHCDGLTKTWSTNETEKTQISCNPAAEGSYTYKVNCQDRYCINEDSKELTITVYKSLEQPSLIASPSGFCTYQMSSLTADKCVGIMEWTTPFQGTFHEIGTNSRSEGAFFPERTSEENFTYKVRCNLNGCLSPEKEVQLSVYPEPPAPVLFSNAPGNTIDRNSRVTIDGACSNGNIVWDDLFTPTVTLASTSTYHAYCRSNATGCQTRGRSSITINVLYFPPGAPLASISGSGTDFVTVSWIDNADNEDGYRIYRASSGAFTDAVELARLETNTTSFYDGGLPEGNTFFYKVVSYNRYDEGHSNIVSGTTSVTPPITPPTVTPPDANPPTVNPPTTTPPVTNLPTVNPPDPPACTVSKPSVVAGSSTITQGQSVAVSAYCASGDVVWTGPAGFEGGNAQPTSTTIYSAKCRVSEGCESAEEQVVVNVNAVGCSMPPTPNVGSGITICRGSTAQLSAGGCESGTIIWSSGSGSVTPDATTSYTAVCSLNGCTSAPSAAQTVTVVSVSPPTVSADRSTISNGASVSVSGSCPDGREVVWTAPDNFTGGSHSPYSATEYKAKCRDSNGCESSQSSTTVSICTSPSVPSVTVADITIQSGGSGTLTANGCTGGTVTWSGGQTGTSLTVMQAGTYTATCTVSNDCGTGSSSDDGSVNICVPPPVPTVTADKYELLPGETANLYASGSGAMIWVKDGLYTAITENVGPGTYKARATNGQCDSDYSSEVVITVKSTITPPQRLAYTGKWLLCDGEQSTARSFSGCDGGIVTVHLNGSIYTNTELIIAQYYSAQCSTSSASTTFSVSSGKRPSAVFISPLLPKIKNGESINLMISATDAKSYKWSTGESGSSITVNPTVTTSYSAMAFSEYNHSGCQTASLQRSVEVTSGSGICTNPPTKPTISSAVSGCRVNLTASNCNGSILWSTNASTSSIQVAVNGTYTAYCSTPNCSEKASESITVYAAMGQPVVEMNRMKDTAAYEVTVAVSKATSYAWVINGEARTETSDTIVLAFGTSFSVKGVNDCGESITYTGSVPNN